MTILNKRHVRLELLGAMSTSNPYITFNSSSRTKMYAAHLDQAISPAHPDIPIGLTGLEPQLRAFDIRMPCDGVIISVHNKFRRSLDAHAIKDNSLMTIIFQSQENGEYDCLDITEYHSKHRIYGVKYILSDIVSKIRPGYHIPRDTILARSPNTLSGNIYSNSLRCNVVNLSIPSTIEDGFAVSESFCKRGALLELPTITGQWGKKYYPLNIYGDDNHFKAYPDVGDKIRPDGLVFAIREYNDSFDALEMTTKSLREVDMINDIRIYGHAGATVYDVTVESGIGESKAKPTTPIAMTKQSERYIGHIREYYNGIIESYETILRTIDKNPRLSPRLNQLITRAYADQPNNPRYKNQTGGIIRRTYKMVQLDEYRVVIKAYKTLELNKGSKLSNNHGGSLILKYMYITVGIPD